ncbi:hypothetical protein FH972_004504 [Carpinus fangiana]|uniref:PORR domain-containing protein n=1 Tax=Carpinus fangiana TaxID=176857 RepID=A0A5N6QNU1_9ROSI|nr:hypothetical protein FH972_004504 [Carpinus fangiana]
MFVIAILGSPDLAFNVNEPDSAPSYRPKADPSSDRGSMNLPQPQYRVGTPIGSPTPPQPTHTPDQVQKIISFDWIIVDLDFAVEREKDLKQAISLKNHILSTYKFSLKYHSLFTQFHPSPHLPPLLTLTRQALALHKEESTIHTSTSHRNDAVRRLAKLLMLTGAYRLPLYVIERLKWDMGLPHNYFLTLLAGFPKYFHVCEMRDELGGEQVLALELVSWRKELAVSELERRAWNGGDFGRKRWVRIAFPMCLMKGFELEKKVRDWVEQWQYLPYISPTRTRFICPPVAIRRRSGRWRCFTSCCGGRCRRRQRGTMCFVWGSTWGLGGGLGRLWFIIRVFFYLSYKIRTQTVVLREAYRKDFLVEKHPLMGMRHRYIHLMNKVPKRGKQAALSTNGNGRKKKGNVSDMINRG